MNFKAAIVFLSVGLLGAPASGMVFWNLDNSANQSDPGTGVPWGSVAAVSNSSGTLRSGSAIYLGGGYMLTANHVTMNTTYSRVTFNGADFYEIDPAFKAGSRWAGKQVLSGSDSVVLDMAVFKLKIAPLDIAPVSLLPVGVEQVAPATMVGWGVGRAESSALGNATVSWGNESTSARRWGLNVPRSVGDVAYGGYSFTSIITIAGGNGTGFDPDGLGNAEAAVTLLDSGSGLFQELAGDWYLIGLANTVERQAGGNTSTFGNDSTSLAGRGDANFFTRISEYHSQILAMVPEPSTGGLAGIGLLGMWIWRRRSRGGRRKDEG